MLDIAEVAPDGEPGLRANGLTRSVIVALGYRPADEFNASLPKTRLPAETVITHL
jgi:nitroreductase/dihydropteridine reductase